MKIFFKKAFIKILAMVLCMMMVFGSAPFSGLIGLELPEFNLFIPQAKATTYSGSCGKNMTWNLDTVTGELVISGTGYMHDFSSSTLVPWYSEKEYINSVKIGAGVIGIGEYAFYQCTRLKDVYYMGDLAGWCGVEFHGYYSQPMSYADNLYINGVLLAGDIIIPDNVTRIGNYAFRNCVSLISVTIPDSVISVGKYAFDNTALRNNSANWENNVLYIDNWLINAKTSISGSYSIKEGTKGIADGAFYHCSGLTSITIPDSVTNIGEHAFDGCTGIKDTYYTGDLAGWCEIEFDSIANPLWYANNLYINGLLLAGNVIIPDGITSIGNYAFYNCTGLTNVTIPDSITSIGDYAFYNCTGLTNVTIPDSITSIGDYAFYNCTGLTSILIPDGVASIGDYAFYNTAFYNNNANWENNVLYIENWLINAKTSISGSYSIKEGTQGIAGYAFYECTSLTSITIPDSITYIGEYAFYKCNSLKDVYYTGDLAGWCGIEFNTIANPMWYADNLYINGVLLAGNVIIPDGITSIGNYVFFNCTSITSVTIPDSVTRIGDGAFFDCTGISSITIPNSVTSIGEFAFYECFNLISISIPDSVTSIGYDAFFECTSLKDVYYGGGSKDWEKIEIGTANGYLIRASFHFTHYYITWSVDGKETVEKIAVGESVNVPEDPSKDYYTFSGWDKTIPTTMPEKDCVITAQFTPIIYYATFVIDGETVATIPYTVETESINAPELPVREGYTERWEDYELVIGGVTVNAVYTINPHTVTWIVDNEETTDNYEYGDTIVKPADPEKEGYTFTGWDAEIPATVPDEDLTFTATWKVNNYTVTWNVDGVIKTENYDYGTKLVKPANPVKEGYTFIGWTNDVPATMPANNLEFVAEWSINPHTVTWVVDNEKTTDTYNFGDTIVKPADPKKEGYTFTGWDAEIPATVPDKDLTFTATWEVNNYTVTWNVDGVIKTENYDYGTKIEKPTTPVKEGYTFKDWTISVPETMPANNLDFVATWDINTYTITWNIGDSVETTEFDYGETVVSPEVNVEGYEFIKWIPDVPETMPAENLEFTAMLASTAFDSGWGTEDNPYIISTKEQLDEARNHLGSSFRLANDIVFTENDFASGGAFYNSGRGWNPIHLYGTFDGNGYVIKGLKINARITASTEEPLVGLFGVVIGTVKNLGLVDGEINVTVTNADEAIIGGIIAFADDESIIDNCFNTCDINVTSSRTITVNSNNRNFMDGLIVGGIIGTGYIDVRNCFNNGDITIDSTVKITPSSYYTAKIEIMPVVGGITGGYSTAKDCYNTGDIDVTVTANRGGTTSFVPKDDLSLIAMAGGISGTMSDVSNCYNEGNISATINDNYKSSNKFNIAAGGGIVSAIGETETVSACYNIGKVSGSTYEGAIAAYSEGTVKDCYYLNNNDVGVGYGEDVTVPCTPEEMASESTYEGFDFDGTWVIGVNGAPKLGGNIVTTEKIEISDAELSVANKETAQLTANLVPAYSTYNGIIWSSSNEEIATVDENGLITAKKIGETIVRATSADGKAFAECIVTVTPADFTITWIVDGNETKETVTETNAIVKPETPVKYGYTFSGWTPDVPDVMPDENMIFNGSFIPIECELVFDATTGAFADGTTKKTETIDFDAQINAPEAPSKAGYIFLGWALNSVNVGTDLEIMDDVDGKRFTAVWVPSTDTRYTVETYTMNTEGEYVKNVQYFTGETDSTVNAEYDIKTGFTLNREKSVLNGTIAADNSLVLKVYIDRNKYTFTTVVDGVSTTKEYLYESAVEKPVTPTKTGYTFVDWDKSAPSTMPAKNVTITAEFDANSYNARFNANGGSWINSTVVKIVATDFDSKIIAPENPTRQGYDFAGWDSEVGVMDDVNGKTFKANWTARNDTKYIVEIYTMDVGGTYTVSKETKKGTTDTTASVTANTSTGFTLNLNKSKLSGTIAADGSLVLKIYYDRNKYSFTKVIENSTIVEKIYFDSPIAKPADPVKPGYKFTGWDNIIPSKMPANDIRITANFELSFKMSIRNPSTTTISYGDSIILHADMNEALPSGWKIKWTADNGNFSYSANGETCTITPSKSGDTTFTATVYDENGNEICKDTQTMKSKAGFFDKFAAFFRKLFGMTKIIQQSINF